MHETPGYRPEAADPGLSQPRSVEKWPSLDDPDTLKDALAWASRRAGLSESATSVDDLLAQLPPLTPEQELEADAAWQALTERFHPVLEATPAPDNDSQK